MKIVMLLCRSTPHSFPWSRPWSTVACYRLGLAKLASPFATVVNHHPKKPLGREILELARRPRQQAAAKQSASKLAHSKRGAGGISVQKTIDLPSSHLWMIVTNGGKTYRSQMK